MCFWNIQFAAGGSDFSTFQWQHSDAGEFGDIICTGSRLTTPPANTGLQRGTFDGPSRILTWEGIEYRDEGEIGGGDNGGGDDDEVPIVDAPGTPIP
jgi:hypothetical protein